MANKSRREFDQGPTNSEGLTPQQVAEQEKKDSEQTDR
mgnify:CR=1 FL=1